MAETTHLTIGATLRNSSDYVWRRVKVDADITSKGRLIARCTTDRNLELEPAKGEKVLISCDDLESDNAPPDISYKLTVKANKQVAKDD